MRLLAALAAAIALAALAVMAIGLPATDEHATHMTLALVAQPLPEYAPGGLN